MKKSLRLTLTLAEELPTPLSVRLTLAGTDEGLHIGFHKGEEIPPDSPIKLEFYYTGELIGFIRFVTPICEGSESKWVSLGFQDSQRHWKDLAIDVPSGPRVLVTLEPIRPLSPIMEMTEASDCSVLEAPCDLTSPSAESTDELQQVVLDLQRERELNSSKQKDLQLKVMELQQVLVKERWKFKMDLEQNEQRHKAEMGHLVIALEKAKAAQKKEAGQVEDLSNKLKASEIVIQGLLQKSDLAQHQEIDQKAELDRLEEAGKRKDFDLVETAGKLQEALKRNGILESELRNSETCVKETSTQLKNLKTELEASISRSERLILELSEAKSELKTALSQSSESCQTSSVEECLKTTSFSDPGSTKILALESENANLSLQIHDLQQSLASLQSALSASHAETDQKDKDLRHATSLYEALKSKSAVFESTVKTLKASISALEGSDPLPSSAESTVPDLVDDLLRDYVQTRQISVPVVRISEGQYTFGSKKVTVTVKNGALVIRVGGGFMFLDEFLKIYGPAEMIGNTPKKIGVRERRGSRQIGDARPRSVGADLSRHHRSATYMSDLSSRPDWPVPSDLCISQHLDSENSTDFGGATERMILKPSNGREASPKPVYWRETVSSRNKVTPKTLRQDLRRSRVMKI